MTTIITAPNPILYQKSEEVKQEEIKDLAGKLKDVLINKEGTPVGVGLAAVQIGIPKKIFLAYSKASRQFLTFINPEIVWYSKRKTLGVPESKNKYEGCLSLPGKWGLVQRSKKIKITYQSFTGQKLTRTFSGQTATIIQHEYDHLNGILFTDRIREQKGKIYELVKDEAGKEYLKEVSL